MRKLITTAAISVALVVVASAAWAGCSKANYIVDGERVTCTICDGRIVSCS